MITRRARDIFGSKKAKRTRQTKPLPPPKTPRQRLIGAVSAVPKAPRRVLPTAVGPGPDKELLALFDGADGLGQCNARLKIARPELTEAERLAVLKAHFAAVNTRWSASVSRQERVRMARRHSAGLELDFADDDPKDDD